MATLSKTLKVVVLMCATAFCLSACKVKTVYVPQVEYRHDTCFIDRTHYDSVFVYRQDSSSVRWVHDTCFVERFKTIYKDKLVVRTDTLVKIETEVKEQTIVQEVEKPLTWYQRTACRWFKWIVLAGVVIALFYLRKWILKGETNA